MQECWGKPAARLSLVKVCFDLNILVLVFRGRSVKEVKPRSPNTSLSVGGGQSRGQTAVSHDNMCHGSIFWLLLCDKTMDGLDTREPRVGFGVAV